MSYIEELIDDGYMISLRRRWTGEAPIVMELRQDTSGDVVVIAGDSLGDVIEQARRELA